VRAIRLFVSSFSILLMPLPSHAQAEFIVLANGDRISGTITRIWDGELIIEPEYSDEFAVDIEAVVSIESDREFEIDFTDGREATAQLSGADSESGQLFVTSDESIRVPLSQVETLDEIEEHKEWDSRIDASSVINEGNTDSRTMRVNANTNLKLGDHRHIGDLILANESLEEDTTKQQSLFQYNYNWLFRDSMFLGIISSYERDPIRNLDDRFIVGSGLGYDFWDSARRSLTMQGGVGYKTEIIDDLREENPIAYWSLRHSYDLRGGDLNLYHNQQINSALGGRSNSVLKTSTGLRFEITDLLYVNFEVAFDYESNPATGAENEDLAILAGIGLEF